MCEMNETRAPVFVSTIRTGRLCVNTFKALSNRNCTVLRVYKM